MYKVYVLYLPGHKKLYIGYSASLRIRLESHNSLGKKDWTHSYRPWVLIWIEEFSTKAEAMNREKQLKGGQGRMWLRNEILPTYYKL